MREINRETHNLNKEDPPFIIRAPKVQAKVITISSLYFGINDNLSACVEGIIEEDDPPFLFHPPNKVNHVVKRL